MIVLMPNALSCNEKMNPARRSRTTDLRMSATLFHYSPPLYQLSYHGFLLCRSNNRIEITDHDDIVDMRLHAFGQCKNQQVKISHLAACRRHRRTVSSKSMISSLHRSAPLSVCQVFQAYLRTYQTIHIFIKSHHFKLCVTERELGNDRLGRRQRFAHSVLVDRTHSELVLLSRLQVLHRTRRRWMKQMYTFTYMYIC